MPPLDQLPHLLERGGMMLLLAVFCYLALVGKIVWGPTMEARLRAEEENGRKWEDRFMAVLEYSRKSQEVVEAAQRVADKAVEKLP